MGYWSPWVLADDVLMGVIVEIRPHTTHALSQEGHFTSSVGLSVKLDVQIVDTWHVPARPLTVEPLDLIGDNTTR